MAGIDTRSWCVHRRRLGGATLFEKLVGARITGNYSLAKFTWIRQQRPELYSRMPTFLVRWP